METYFDDNVEQEMTDDVMRCVLSDDTPLFLNIPKWEFTHILSLEHKNDIGTYLLEVLACFARPDKWGCSANVERIIKSNWDYYYKKKGEQNAE